MQQDTARAQVIKNIIKRIDKNDSPTVNRVNTVSFILNRFFEYAYIAAIHGRHIRATNKGGKKPFSFRMNYFYIENVPDKLKRRIKFSSKATGYIFVLDVEIPTIQPHGFKFRVDQKWLEKAAEIAETDIVYQLIKKRHGKKVYKTRNH